MAIAMMSKSIALGLVGAGAVLLAILLAGCSGAPSPTTEPTATPATVLTPTPEPTPTPAAATLSLGVYLTLCAPTESDLADDTTYGDYSSLIRAEADRFEALTPPAQLSEWHLLNIEAYRAAQAGVDTQPQDDVVDFDNPTMNAVFDDFEETLGEAAARLSEDVLQRMIEAGCIDPYLVPDDYEDVPDDHGDSEGDATAIGVGADVRGTLDYDGDIDFFRFQAERGQSYQIDVALGTLDDSIVDLYDVDWSFLDSNDDYGTSASRLYWEAPSSGERYVLVGGYGTGTYTLTVSHSTIVDDHGDDIDDATVAATPLSLDEYLTLCVTTEQDLADDATFGDFSSLFAAEADRLEALTPPAQLSEWHLLNIEGFRTIQAFVDLQPKDDVIDIARFFLMAAISADSEEKLGEVAARLPEDVLQQMIEAGCIDPDGVPYDYADVSDDHGNNFDSATRIVIGETVGIELEDVDDEDVFVFRLAPDREYVFTLYWESYEIWADSADPLMTLFDADGRVLASLRDYDSSAERNRNRIIWQAVTGGDYYIGVGNGVTRGFFALTVTEGGAAEPFVSVSAGGRHTCGVRSNGSVACWGSNADGRATPPAGSFLSVSARHNHTCGLRSDGSVACWGDDFAGEATPLAGSFLSVSAGWLFTCGVRSNGSIGCWGWNESGEATPPAGSFLSVSAGEGHTCGVRSNGSVACWGSNGAGQATPPAGSFLSVSAGWLFTCGVRSNGSVACWGSNADGRATPPAGSFVSVSAGEGHTCGVRSNGSVACWGDNYDGEATPPAGSFVSVSTGFAHTCGVRSDGSVACWGWNGNGQATPPE